MGRTYLFDCEKCGYQAKVAGGVTEGLTVQARTVVCLECKELFDAVTAAKFPLEAPPQQTAPLLEDAVHLLLAVRPAADRWDSFALACVVDSHHEVAEWNDPGTCPRCGIFLERSGMPFRQWD